MPAGAKKIEWRTYQKVEIWRCMHMFRVTIAQPSWQTDSRTDGQTDRQIKMPYQDRTLYVSAWWRAMNIKTLINIHAMRGGDDPLVGDDATATPMAPVVTTVSDTALPRPRVSQCLDATHDARVLRRHTGSTARVLHRRHGQRLHT